MEEVIIDILNALRQGDISSTELDALLREHSKRLHDGRRHIAKKYIMPFFLSEKARAGEPGSLWSQWDVTPELEQRFKQLLKMKPRRTASGVATITVITKPWPCAGSCIFCPNDIRMPKSYLHDEPACQRAERNYFDPYLQVASRLQALNAMGHSTDKIELIILGGTWTDYPLSYQLWFTQNLFEALNDSDEERIENTARIRKDYESRGIKCDADEITVLAKDAQRKIDAHEISYNEAYGELYGPNSYWAALEEGQRASLDTLQEQQHINESVNHRVVGLVIETRPDAITPRTLTQLRQIGCTKIQMGIQSLSEGIRTLNSRPIPQEKLVEAFELSRLFGFKTHIHQMVNLMGSTPESDREDYRQLVTDSHFLPDEIKLYPCALIASSELERYYQEGKWTPYNEDELVAILADDLRVTPAYTRVSRMIRDFSAYDIIAGSKKTNLRQMVEASLADDLANIQEIRLREVGVGTLDLEQLELDCVNYETSCSREHFLQMISPERKIAGFLRLSLPKKDTLHRYDELPVQKNEAMIREVHVYGFAAEISQEGQAVQHHGLGKQLIEKACEIAREAGYQRLNVISAVGTRGYYRKLGFTDNGLYQQKQL